MRILSFVFGLAVLSTTAFAQQMNSFGMEALQKMSRAGYNVTPSIPYLAQFSNEYQVQAVAILIDDKRTDISDKMPGILQFQNSYAVEALYAMVLAGREIGITINDLSQVSNAYQVRAIQILTTKKDEEIRAKMSSILLFNNPYQVEALQWMVSANREIGITIVSLAKICNRTQTDTLINLIKARAPIRDNFTLILDSQRDCSQ